MCQTFHLQFHHDTGIIAWADPTLYDSFAGPAMRQGDYWKICLGRQIELDEDDLDGSEFIENLLEDAVFFPVRSSHNSRIHERWETVEESPGIWFTRPMNNLEPQVEEQSDADTDSDTLSVQSWRSDEEACDDEGDLLEQAQDAALENPPDNHSAVCVDEYESSEDEERDSDSEMDDDFDPSAPDAVWASDTETYENDEVIEVDGGVTGVDNGAIDVDDITSGADKDPYDSADSDFDSQEELSGDEMIIEGGEQRKWMAEGWRSMKYNAYNLGSFY